MPINVKEAIEKLRQELDDCEVGEFEICFFEDTKAVTYHPRIRNVIQSWCQEKDHTARTFLVDRFECLSQEEAKAWLLTRLTKDLVFDCKLLNKWHAGRIVDSFFSFLQFDSFYRDEFIIKDYTFSDVLIASDTNSSILIAFIGED